MKHTKRRLSAINTAAGILLGLAPFIATAQVTPGGTFCDKAIFVEAGGGETLGAAGAGTLGPVLINGFDTTISSDATYQLNPSASNDAEIALSSGRHLVMYNTRINDPGGNNRAEFQTNLTLDGIALAAGRAQGYIRRAGSADEAVMSGGAIITVDGDDDILTLETRRSDNNGDGNLPRRTPGLTAIQLLKLDNDWDYLNLQRAANQTGVNNSTFIDVAYDTIDGTSQFGSAFTFTAGSGDITLNEEGLYLIFANTSIEKPTNDTRTQYNQRLTLDGVEVAGSETTTYVRGNENTDNGVAVIGRVLSASAGQVLNVEVNKEASIGSNGIIQGGETAITMIKLPAFAEYISLLDTTNQEVNDNPGPGAVTFANQVDVSSSKFSHSAGTSAVTVNEDSDYLFFGTVFASSDGTNNNQDRIVPLHGWQLDGAGGPLAYGRGAQYLRDDQVRTSGSWGAAILSLLDTQSVELTTQALGNADQGAGSTIALQGLSIESLRPPTFPIISKNVPFPLEVSTTGTITSDFLNTVDSNTPAASLTYTVDSIPTGGVLSHTANGPITILGTFTQEDLDNNSIEFTAGAVPGPGGFDFTVTDGSSPVSGTFVIPIGVATVVSDDTGSTDEDTPTSTVDVAASSLLDNDLGTDLSVAISDPSSTMGATVNVNTDGTFTYDPTASAAIQALDDGDSVPDTFTYTVTDYSGTPTVGNVTITLNGVNDDPVVVNDAASGTDQAGPILNVLSNDSDIDANDTLSVVSINGTPVPATGITLLSSEDATITITPDGTLIYDPSTSADIVSLPNGDTLPDTIDYEVSDGTVTVAGTITITSTGTLGASDDLALVGAAATTTFPVLDNDDLLGAPGTPTAGAIADFNAADVGNTSTTWINNGNGIDIVMEGPGVESVLNTSLSGAPVGVTAAYDLSGTGSGSQIEDADNANSIYGALVSQADLSLEMVFRPDDLVGDEPLWGTGGNGTGSSLVLLDDQLIFTAGQGAVVVQVTGTLPSTDYVHVIASLNLATDTAELYINNVLADSSTAINITDGSAADITDWSGTDAEGLGRSAGTTGGDVNVAPFLGAFGTVDIPDFNDAATGDRFDGEIAILRVYSGSVLDATARTANYTAVVGTPSTPAVGDIINLAGETTLVPGTTVVTLPSGATVKLESNGELTYDPNGAFDHIATGLEGIDSFTYMLGGNQPATATVTVRIFGSNSDPQVTITADQTDVTEGSLAGFTLSATSNVASNVTANLSYSGTAIDGTDFTGQATKVINSGTDTADLDLATIADSLFENGVETILVTIDSVTGPGTVGANPQAITNLIDGDAAPVFTISGGGAVTEGSTASFTATASVASSAAITLDVGYPGSATAADFNPITQITVPAMATTATLNLFVFDDGIADGGETIVPTLSNSSLGSIGAPDSATATISDGSGMTVFFADFENVDPLDTPGGTLLNTDAPDAANLGTAVGYWANVLSTSSTGAAPGLILEANDVRGDGIDTMLRQDRPDSDPEGELCAVFDGVIDISGSNSGTISFDFGQLRTLTPDKNTHIIGLDPAGNKSFELVVNGDNANPSGRSLYHVDSVGTQTQISPFNSFPNTQDFGGGGNNESAHTNVRLSLTATGYVVALDHPLPVPIDGVPDLITDELAYAGNATLVSKILFQIAGSTDANFNGGIFLDNVSAAGTSLTTQEAWRQVYYGSPANSGAGADSATAANGLTNLENFALGLDPTVPAGTLDVDAAAGTITTLGSPEIWEDPNTGLFYLRYTRRADAAVVGLDIVDEFSRNPNLPFEVSAVPATVIANGSSGGVAIEALQNEFPFALPISGGKARYGRVTVTLTP